MTETALLITAIGLVLAMTGAWAIQRVADATGWIDAIWTTATGLAGVALALWPLDWPEAVGNGPSERQVLVALLVAAWSVRLAVHIVRRTLAKPDDPRYARIREEWGAAYSGRLFGLMQIQALAGAVLAFSVFVAARNPAPGLRLADLIGVVLILIAVAGEGIADAQLRRFVSDPANHGKVCQNGLWGWSRHPNYFFEWLGWLAYPIIAIDIGGAYPWGWASLAGPGLMYWLLVHVSGIPPLEAHMERSRGDSFRSVQARVSPFFPWPSSSMR